MVVLSTEKKIYQIYTKNETTIQLNLDFLTTNSIFTKKFKIIR